MTAQTYDEGYTDTEDDPSLHHPTSSSFSGKNVDLPFGLNSVEDTEELAYQLLASLPRSRLATIQRRLAPLLQFDVVGSLPAEVSLLIFSNLPFPTLLSCSLVSRRWNSLANDQTLWKNLCFARGWQWRQPPRMPAFGDIHSQHMESWDDSDDEGMGDSDEETEEDEMPTSPLQDVEAAKAELTLMHAELDSGFSSMSISRPPLFNVSSTSSSTSSTAPGPSSSNHRASIYPYHQFSTHKPQHPASSKSPYGTHSSARHSAPSILSSTNSTSYLKPNYKLLYLTHIKLQKRILTSSFRLTALQTRGTPTNSHTSTIYCLQLYTYPTTGVQVLFTGSRDKTVREWNLSTGAVERVIEGGHRSSVLSICVHNGYLASAGSDNRVAVWDLEKNKLIKIIQDHDDSVLCVRFDDERLVSCSKDRTVRTYSFPDLEPQFVLGAHRAAVNAVSISSSLIVSGSGDRSIRLWDAKTGKLLRTFPEHHGRGIASIDFSPPYILSGSSDKHLRLFDITSRQGWSTSPPTQDDESSQSSPLPLSFPFGLSPFQPIPGTSTSPGSSLVLGSTYDGNFASPFAVVSSPGSRREPILCQTCGSSSVVPLRSGGASRQGDNRSENNAHSDLVRSVAFGEDFVLSGSYDSSIKVWDRKTGALVADLTGGHTGRIFCIGFDCTKIVSCSEDQRICIWDFAHGIDTSFLQL
ncbi:WD40 repeat-like protein [Dendrothele bispora CBS 962.96]|uniref:WD40 repeat-like protein n=1 Tax=Dendrothele bispora (strain CBS 962.96) TaxID=1314807 RepID=A0A4S8MM27_DENBC|nr:WD40 repeat-like protein [Dendrothele bispora CBS 962.96]